MAQKNVTAAQRHILQQMRDGWDLKSNINVKPRIESEAALYEPPIGQSLPGFLSVLPTTLQALKQKGLVEEASRFSGLIPGMFHVTYKLTLLGRQEASQEG